MAHRDVVVVGASAGGVEALSQLVSRLPGNLPAAVLITMHVASHATSILPSILERAGSLPCAHAVDGTPILKRRVYVAPPNRHLLMRLGRVALSLGPKENGSRPAVDAMFRAAAREYGRRVVGVVLSGTLDDGTAGLAAIRALGGLCLAQKPDTAMYRGMPQSAISAGVVDAVLDIPAIAALIAREAGPRVPDAQPAVSDAKTKSEPELK